MENRVQKFRKSKGLSQKQLAELVGTSQQQIQRIENNLITAKLEMAAKLANALDKPLNSVFPGSGKVLKAIETEMATSRYLPNEQWKTLRETGIEGDPRTWFFQVQLRGHTKPILFQVPTADKTRLYSSVQEEGKHHGIPFVVFDTEDKRVALNLAEVVYCQFLFEYGVTLQDEDEECYMTSIFFNNNPTPLQLNLEPEYKESEEDWGDGCYCNHIFFMVELDPEPTDRFLIKDEDGDDTFIRIGDVALFEVPLTIVEPENFESNEDEEDAE